MDGVEDVDGGQNVDRVEDYVVTARHTGDLTFTTSNGRTTVRTEWNPADGAWLATELFLSGLGACMLATLVDHGQRHGIDVEGATVRVAAESATRPLRMSRLHVTYGLPAGLSDAEVASLVRAGNRCKVHHTIEGRPEMIVTTRELGSISGV